jgi:hypothetical protein
MNIKPRDINWYRNRVKLLCKKPQPPQRSVEWFRARNTRITASEAACCLPLSELVCKTYVDDFNVKNFKYKPDQCLSHYDNREDYIINKCRTFFGENLYKDSIYTLHGKKYEEIATRLYRKKFNTEVLEFGLISHSRLNWMAASPDGITPNGIMLEIKCPYSRKIEEGVPPIWYWAQMQYQMESVDLDECDFLECEIKELNNENDFISQNIDDKQDKGILLNKVDEAANSETKYIYPPDNLDIPTDYINWSNDMINKYKQQNINIQPIYYFINKWFVIRVKRRKEWFNNVKHYFKDTIDIIRKLQNNKEDFIKYKESIDLIKNKKYIEKYNNTICLINESEQNIFFSEMEQRQYIHSEFYNDNEPSESMVVDTKDYCMIETTE